MIRVATNISSRFGVFRMIPDSRVFWVNLCVDIWDVPQVLAGKHPFGYILAEFHCLFLYVSEESIT